MFTEIVLWLLVVNLGVVFGAGLYEARISVARWTGASLPSGRAWHAEEALRDDVGRRFWAFTTTVPLTLLTLTSAWLAWRSSGAVRPWWLAAAAAALADRLFTFGYFIPRMVGLLRSADSPEARAKMTAWRNLNYVRLALVLIAWLAALQAFALSHASQAISRV
jgi:hypothetical protein